MHLKKIIAFVILLLAVNPTFGQDSTRAISYSAESRGLNDISLVPENEIEVYPNPSIDFIIVNIKNSKLRETSFELHSLIGNTILVYPEEIGHNKYRINIKGINAGYYFVIIKDEYTHFKQAYKFLKK